jgi:hypothetical protein
MQKRGCYLETYTLACILLAFAAFSATLGKSASVTPHARSAGMLSLAESALTQSMPSALLDGRGDELETNVSLAEVFFVHKV